MMLGFFRRRKTETIRDVIARQDYDRALEMIRAELMEHPGDRRLRLQLADVLLLAGQQDEAVGRLEVLADELAGAGFASQSIAILRRIKSLAPTRDTVDEKLNHLLHPGLRRTPPRARSDEAPHQRGTVGLPMGVPIGAQHVPDPEEIRPLEESEPRPWVAPPPAPAPPSHRDLRPPERATPTAAADHVELFDEESPFFFDASSGAALLPGGALLDDAEIEISVEEDLEEYVRAEGAGPGRAAPPEPSVPRIFADVPREALGAILDALPREHYEAGEIVLTEGDPGTCIYAIERGLVRVYVKARDGRNGFLRTLAAGEVFGEIAVLTRKKRTATVTAAAPCEVVCIDLDTLERIVAEHPEVQDALFGCFDERANDPAETALRGKKSRRTIPGRRKPPARPRRKAKKAE